MIKDYRIKLVNDTITQEDIKDLSDWLLTNPRLTKGEKTIEFEEAWSKWQGREYSVFVNSGSSANLAMLYALKISNRLKNDKVIVPAISWVTTVAPVMQLGFEPIMCEADSDTLGVDINHLEALLKKHKPAALIIVHVLGFPNKMKEIGELCKQYDVILLEDSCESMGSTYHGWKTGNFGLMSSFSTYYGHHFSTIEGGLVCTDDEELYHILLSIRSHGWDRDLPEGKRKALRDDEGVSEFRALYTFYYPGFNLRSTDLQAFIGLRQLQRLDVIVQKRNDIFKYYHARIQNDFWKIQDYKHAFVSNFAYPLVLPEHKFEKTVKALQENGIEIRPLVCGSIAEQPFWKKSQFGHRTDKYLFSFSRTVHNYGLYLPNNPRITKENVRFICDIINNIK